MTYIVFARKWRPKAFDEIIGQGHITQTLKNAIKNDRVAHAYIFAGPRGIGKTSAARILAKALNCEKGPLPDPCNKCTSCKEISESRSLDVLEIDGASNRGIDEIRNLRENVKFASSQGKFKIYIIDEVHMLTQPAFNALLKTLEEPPAHVKFVFATTQPDKVLPTILSRCQRFDFRKILTRDIVGKLSLISKQEHLEISDEALFAIARAADGSMRDAESVLDQLSSFSNKKIELSNVTQVLGTLNEEILLEIVDAISKKDASKALRIIDNLIREGKDVSFVTLELLEHFRNLLIAKIGKDLNELIDLPEDAINNLSRQSKNFTMEDLLYTLNVLSTTYDTIRRSNLSRIPLEMGIIKLTEKDSIRSIGQILDKVSLIEEKIKQDAIDIFTRPEEKKKPVIERAQVKEETREVIPEQTQGFNRNEMTLKQIEHIWPSLIKKVRLKKISIASYLLEGEPVSYEGDILTLGFLEGHSFNKEVIEEAHNRKIIEEALSEMVGRTSTLKFTTIKERRKPNNIEFEEQAYAEDGSLQDESNPDTEEPKDPIVDSALGIFKGKIINKKKNKE